MKEQGSESTCAAPTSAGGQFRVRVCMERFFSDERARAFVCVRRARRVRWLAARLRQQFALPPQVALLCRGHLLPPDEPLALLQPDERVDVVPTRINLDRHQTEDDDVASCTDISLSGTRVDDSDAAGSHDIIDGHSSTVELESDAITSTPPRPCQEPNGDNELCESKRRALLLLEQFCEQEPRARRRRVRRRRQPLAPAPPRPPAAPACPSTPAGAPTPTPPPAPACITAPTAPLVCSPAPTSASFPTPSPPPSDSDIVVLRNDAHGPRAPRLIRPLASSEL